MKRSIIWFRNDLRLHDNEALNDALNENDEIIPIYIFDDRIFSNTTNLGFPKTNKFRSNFIIETVHDLRKNLRKLGSELIVRKGKPEEVIYNIALEQKTRFVYCNRERTQEEVNVQDALEYHLWQIGQEVRYSRGKMLYHTSDLPFPISHCPDIFTQFRKEVEKYIPIRPPLDLAKTSINPPPINLDAGIIPLPSDYNWTDQTEHNEYYLKGGESSALKELHYYLWESDLISTYNETRNELLGRNFSSKFSAYLAQGCLSPKKIYSELKNYEEAKIKNKSTYWLFLELLWRDFFRFMAKKHGNNIFKPSGIKQAGKPISLERPELFEKWKQGCTGIPFIDANMRELNSTGFMSNRGRQNVASFLINDLKLNWILGAEYFESMLIDYDPCSNYGNWNNIAGIGTNPKDDRSFNIASQAKKYDPNGKYIKHWVPELENAPLESLHNPFNSSNSEWYRSFNYVPPCIHIKNWN